MWSLASQKIKHHLSCEGNQFKLGKSLVFDQNCDQKQTIKEVINSKAFTTKKV